MGPPAETPRGPVIAFDKVEPNGEQQSVNIGSACRQDFTIGEIEDENTGDTIYYRWFVDYEYWGIYKASGKIAPAADRSVIRKGPTYTLDATSSLVLSSRTADSVHPVTLIVSDRPFEEDSTIQPAFMVVTEGGRTHLDRVPKPCASRIAHRRADIAALGGCPGGARSPSVTHAGITGPLVDGARHGAGSPALLRKISPGVP